MIRKYHKYQGNTFSNIFLAFDPPNLSPFLRFVPPIQISGTAAKLGRPNAYHHCTLLVNANKLHLSDSLVKDTVS